jgi:hypothetical protein
VSDIVLPWPPASLSGHNTGHWRARNAIISQHREWAKNATLAANPAVPETGDIRLVVAFFPPNRRGDRLNYSNRAKPYFDGIADALKVNDRRFVPSYVYGEPERGGRVVISVEPPIAPVPNL